MVSERIKKFARAAAMKAARETYKSIMSYGASYDEENALEAEEFRAQKQRGMSKFNGKALVNGLSVRVRWLDHSEYYELYIPEASAHNQVVDLGTDTEKAKRVFEYAKNLADRFGDADKVIKTVNGIVENMP